LELELEAELESGDPTDSAYETTETGSDSKAAYNALISDCNSSISP
jgi:hypothetical protein